MRTVYQVHTHQAPAQVYRLVDSLLTTSSDPVVVVSHAHGSQPLDLARLRRNGDVLVVDSVGGYADWSHIRRYLQVLDHLADKGIQYDWMVNLTGQDYPVRPLHEAEAELARCGVDGFMQYFPVLSDISPWGRGRGRTRYWFHHRRLGQLRPQTRDRLRPLQGINFCQPLVRVKVADSLSIGWRTRAPFDADFICYGGSVHATLNRACAEALRQFARERPDVVRHYQACLSPGESYLQTALVNGGRFALCNNSRRYVDFTGSRRGHPRILQAADVETARASGAHFARKWDLERDPDAFGLLDSYVFG